MEEELRTLREARTWEVVDAPKDANLVGSKWVFRAKKDAAENVVRCKAFYLNIPGISHWDLLGEDFECKAANLGLCSPYELPTQLTTF